MSSINRRLMGTWLGDRLGRLFLSVLLLLLLVPAAWLGTREAAQFGGISRKTERDFAVTRDEGGKAKELTYRAVTKDGQELALNVLPELKTWLVICGIILLLRLLWLFIHPYYKTACKGLSSNAAMPIWIWQKKSRVQSHLEGRKGNFSENACLIQAECGKIDLIIKLHGRS